MAIKPERLRHLIGHSVEPMPAADGVQALSHLLRISATQVAVLRANWDQWRSGLPPGVDPPLLAHLGRESLDGTLTTGGARAPRAHLNDEMRRAGPAERQRLLESYLRDQAAGKLGLAPSRLDIELPLNHLGVDSLIATELRTQIERDLGIVVPVVTLLDGPTITRLATRLGDRRVNSVCDLDQLKVVFGFRRTSDLFRTVESRYDHQGNREQGKSESGPMS